jgi:serine protease DegS
LANTAALQQRVQRALGSGVIVDESGHIITNNHVIANATTIRVQLADGRSGGAKVVGRDPDTDLALLSIQLTKLPVMRLGRSDRLQVGDEVLAIGNPLGLQQTVTHGTSAPSIASSWAWRPSRISSRPTRPSTKAIPAAP